MGWTIEYADAAGRQLRKLNPQQRKRIMDYMDDRIATADDPRQFGEPLVGDRAGYWRFRVGDFRFISELVDNRLLVLVVKIGHRRDIYHH